MNTVSNRKLMVTVGMILAILPLLLASLVIGCQKQQATASKQQTEFERMAGEMPYLDIVAVLYDRREGSFYAPGKQNNDKHYEILQNIGSGKYPKDELLKLLSHQDPKVRTLAVIALFDLEDPVVLPDLVKLTDDNAPTFDRYERISVALYHDKPYYEMKDFMLAKQTVADVAKKLVAFYMERAGYHYGVLYEGQPGFKEYWQAHKDRSYCASWFAVQLARATYGTIPTPENSIERVKAVRKRIDALPPDERTWELLSLCDKDKSDALVTDSELVDMCKALGPDKLMLMLQGKIPSDDPDLQSAPGVEGTNGMARFVLSHAETLLRPADGDAVLALQRRDTELWAVAAAHLKPEKASQILHDALPQFNLGIQATERACLCVALWQIVGEPETKFIVDWLYTEPAPTNASNPREDFVEAMRNDPKGKDIVGQIIMDPRFDTIDLGTLRVLVYTVNQWFFASERELQELDRLNPMGAEAEQKYPEQAAKLRQQMSDWRERLRKAVPKFQENN